MTSGKQLQSQEKLTAVSLEELEARSEFTDFNVNIVVIVLAIVAFVPAFLDEDFYDPIGRFIVMIVLGVGYCAVAVVGTAWHERNPRWWTGLAYFGVQLTIIVTLMLMSGNISENFWMLMLPLSGQGFSLGGWRQAIALALLMLVLFVAVVIFMQDVALTQAGMRDLTNALLSIGSAMFFVMLFSFIAVREGQTRREMALLATDLREANHRLAEYAGQIEELATTRERNRLARDIHDNLGHYLTVVNVQIEAAKTVMRKNPDKAEDALEKAQRLTQEGLSSVRQSVSALRESPIGDGTLLDGIDALAAETRATGLDVSVVINGQERPLLPKSAMTLYRAVQEGLTNTRKHAQATAVSIQFDFTMPNSIQLTVSDNGIGASETSGGFGLLGLRERVQLLNGRLEIHTQPDEGFRFTITLPTVEDKP